MRVTRVLGLCVCILALTLGGCGFGPSGGQSGRVPPSITIGFTVSQSGSYDSVSQSQVQGFELWADQVNAAGGIAIGDDTVQVALLFYNDESSGEQVPGLYSKLINEDKADFLFSPYGSSLAAAAAVVAEQYGKIMIATGAASDSIFDKGYQYVFQIYTPASRYLAGAIDMLKSVDPSATRVAIIYEDASFAIDVANFAREYAQERDLEIVLFEAYPPGTVEFGPIIENIVAAEPDAILGGGHSADGIALAEQLYEQQVTTKLISLLVAPAAPEFAEIGGAALYVTGPSQWEPQAQYGPEGAATLGIQFFGPTVGEFAQAYTDRYGVEPSYHASGGYAAGLVLQRALEEAGSVDPARVQFALERMDLLTCYGRIKFDTRNLHGLQIGHEMVYLQWQQDSGGQLVKQVVWPEAGRSAPLLYPRQLP